ncbi:MAG: ABC transporter permease subunit [Ardenticatenaceae bacterium]|nr:ABC transporter permease subunit [Ardenticatenaceae bacterium]
MRSLRTLLNPRADLSQLGPLNADPASARSRLQLRHFTSNGPLLFGGFIVIILFLLVLFGPLWAPRNPYIAGQHIVPHFDPVQDEWISPPLAPSAEYPLGTDEYGNDILSMLLYGARNTLIAAAFITMVRVIVGLILGAYAGWNDGRFPDQLVMALISITTAVPMLISSMILVFALDIRRGLPVFIIALAAIGWTEIAQYIRGEFLILRKMPYIEGAQAAGATNFAIAVRHILPNLLPQLLIISFLELGATLMLMGELAFVGIFIGGGSRIALGDEITGINVVTLSEVPEWGAMLAEGYRWLRAKPFIVFPPAIAFFIAVVGFNTFGEGLRRLIEQHHVSTNFLLRKRMILVIALLTYATIFIINNTGPAPWFARVARAFNGESAYDHTAALAAMNGRSPTSPDITQAATYIADHFIQYGLQPGWKQSEYIYPRQLDLVRPLTQPQLILHSQDGDRAFQHQRDFGFVLEGHGGGGQVEYPLTFLTFAAGRTPTWEDYKTLDLRDRIILLDQATAPPDFANEALIRGAQGILWLTDDSPAAVRSQTHAANLDSYNIQPHIPIFRIRPSVATTILNTAGQNLSTLTLANASQHGPGWMAHDLDVTIEMSLDLSAVENTAVPTILGYLPGSDFAIANELIILLAPYDGLGIDPDGTLYPSVNQGASGIGVLLELARLWQEQDLEVRRSVLFIAWGGQLNASGLEAFLSDPVTVRHLPAPSNGDPLTPHVIIQLDYAGAGVDALAIHPGSAVNLANLLREAAATTQTPIAANPDPTDIIPLNIGRAAWLNFTWANPVSTATPTEDTLNRIEPEKLQTYGEILSHLLTEIVRQSRY